MASTIQLLLRLPPPLRSHALLNLSKSAPLRRASTKTPPPPPQSRKPAPKSSTPPPPPRQPPKSSPPPPTPPPKSSPPPPPAPPTTTTPPPTSSNELSRLSRIPSTGGPSLRSLVETQHSVLLYNSPNHTSFFLTSYLLAGLLVSGAVLQATSLRDSFFSEDRKRTLPWWTGALSGTACLTTVLIATAIGLAPTRLVRTIRLVGQSGGGGGVVLRVGLKHPFPLLATKKARDAVIEAPLSEVFLDRRIPIAGPNLTFNSIPRTEAATWTASAKTPAKGSRIAQNVRRMFLREGLAYMRIEGHGRWKLDLQGSEMLDGGRCLEEAIAPDMQPVKGLVGFLRGLMG